MTHAAAQLMAPEEVGPKAVDAVDAAAAVVKEDVMMGGWRDEPSCMALALGGSPTLATPSGWPSAFAAFDSSDSPTEDPAAVAEVVAAVDVDAVASNVAALAAAAADVAGVANGVDANFCAAADVAAKDVSADADAIAAALCYDLLHDSP